MDPSLLALLVAIVGVVGTLFAPAITALTAAKGKEQEAQLKEIHDRTIWDRDEERRRFTDLRDCYVALNTSARSYQGALRGLSHALDQSVSDLDVSLNDLVPARQKYRERYAEAQMIVSDPVLLEASCVNGLLAESYGMLMRLAAQNGGTGDSAGRVREILDECIVRMRNMRRQMRTDLGIEPEAGRMSDGGGS